MLTAGLPAFDAKLNYKNKTLTYITYWIKPPALKFARGSKRNIVQVYIQYVILIGWHAGTLIKIIF